MSISVSIVTYRSRSHLGACLAALRGQGAVSEVHVADNGSGDGTVQWLREHHPRVRVHDLGENRGYAAAHNHNFAVARGDFFLALNPDVVLGDGALVRMLRALEADPEVAAVSGRLLQTDGSGRIDSAGISPDRGRTRFIDRGRGQPAERFDREEDVFGACGAAALYRRAALEAVSQPGESPFAERFFMYYEDVDLAWRLRGRGYRTRYVPGAESLHVRGGSGARNDFVEYHLVRNRLWLSLRNARGLEALLELPGLLLFEAVKSLQACWRPHLRSALADQLRGVPISWSERRRAAGRP